MYVCKFGCECACVQCVSVYESVWCVADSFLDLSNAFDTILPTMLLYNT